MPKEVGDVASEVMDPAPLGAVEAAYAVQDRGLSGPVWTYEGEDLPWGHVEGDVHEGLNPAEAQREALDPQCPTIGLAFGSFHSLPEGPGTTAPG